jgi:hypothetical protein
MKSILDVAMVEAHVVGQQKHGAVAQAIPGAAGVQTVWIVVPE